MFLRRNCKEICALLIAREDQRLAASERLTVKLHLLACKQCPRFERQIIAMRNSLKRWRSYQSLTE